MKQIKNSKLIVVTRRDIHIGYQAVQAGHAAIEFQYDYPEVAKDWHDNSNYLIFLSTDDEAHLKKLIIKATEKGIKYTIFREPDIGNQITAVAFEPSEASRKLTSSCPLMGKEVMS